jgi:ATP/maltotriose-dependent transcriptional regulator MalT
LPKAPVPTIFPYNICVPETLLQTKLYIPPLRPNLVRRPKLIDHLNQGLALGCKLTLISAPAGFGKTTLLSEWVRGDDLEATWVSLDVGDNDLPRFLAYFIAALQTIEPTIGHGALGLLQSPQPPVTEMILTALINEVAEALSVDPEIHPHALVLDDYHLINALPVHEALTFILEHLPPQMHLVIASRTDPPLPLPRLRIRSEMVELREVDLRFTIDETSSLFNRALGLHLAADSVGLFPQIGESDPWTWVFLGAGMYGTLGNFFRVANPNSPNPTAWDYTWSGGLLVIGLAGMSPVDIFWPIVLVLVGVVILSETPFQPGGTN